MPRVTPQANALYEQAARAAVSDLQRARFVLGKEQARLRSGPLSEARLATLRGNMERFQGQRTGYEYARTYARRWRRLGRARRRRRACCSASWPSFRRPNGRWPTSSASCSA